MFVLNKISYYLLIVLFASFIQGCTTETKIKSVVQAKVSLVTNSPTNIKEKSQSAKVFPSDIGWIDIKKDFGAKGDGINDDTVAIKKALATVDGDYTRPKIIYFPQGTYLVSDTLQLREDKYACCVTFQGQGKEKTIIKLEDGANGFADKSQPKAVIRTKKGNKAFRNFFRDLTVNTGRNNPGVVGIDYISSNRGAIINVAIKSEDGAGQTGLAMIRKWPGPSLIKHVSVEGFDYGIHTKHPEYGIVLEHIELKNQNIAGILNENNTLAIRSITSTNSVPVIHNKNGLVVAMEGDFQGGAVNSAAINNQGYLYARDIQTQDYQSAIANQEKFVPKLAIDEYISHPAYSLFDSPQKSLNLPIEEMPDYHDNNLNNWANVNNYPSVQAAMNSGKSTIYFPMGRYKLHEALEVPATVKKIVGFESFINLNQEELQAIITIAEDSKDPLIIEGMLFDNTAIRHNSKRTLAIKHTKFSADNKPYSFPQAGKLFLEDVQMYLQVNKNQQVWARQLNSETLLEGKTKINNDGGKLWILGLKTEGKGTVIKTTEGGETELLGTLVYPVKEFSPEEQKEAAFVNQDSSHSLIYSVRAYGAKRNYEIQVKETRDNKTKKLYSSDVENLKIPLFVGY